MDHVLRTGPLLHADARAVANGAPVQIEVPHLHHDTRDFVPGARLHLRLLQFSLYPARGPSAAGDRPRRGRRGGDAASDGRGIALRRPALERLVLGDPREVGVGGEQAKLMADAELGQHGVDGSYLNAPPASAVAELSGLEVVMPGGLRKGRAAK